MADIRGILRDMRSPLSIESADQIDALVEALEMAEDVLSRAPFSTQMWPNGMHPNTGIEQIRDVLRRVGSPATPEVKP